MTPGLALGGVVVVTLVAVGCALPRPIDAPDAGGGDRAGRDAATDAPGADTPAADTAPGDVPADDGADADAPGDMTADGTGFVDGPIVEDCSEIDLTGAPEVPLAKGPFEPAGTGGTLTTARWLMTDVIYSAPGFGPVIGSGQAVLEILAADPTSGLARVRLRGQLNGPVFGTFDQSGVGGYTVDGNVFTIEAGCSGQSPVRDVEYTVSGATLTVWTTIQVLGVNLDVTATLMRQE
jgi:hypothetical protein